MVVSVRGERRGDVRSARGRTEGSGIVPCSFRICVLVEISADAQPGHNPDGGRRRIGRIVSERNLFIERDRSIHQRPVPDTRTPVYGHDNLSRTRREGERARWHDMTRPDLGQRKSLSHRVKR